MENKGVSVEMRTNMMEDSNAFEILSSVAWHPVISQYRFGSQAEGTTTIDMNSDIDTVHTINLHPVVTELPQVPLNNCLLFVQDNTTNTGYCKLQLVRNGIPQYGDSPSQCPCPYLHCKIRLYFSPDVNKRLVCSFKLQHVAAKHYDERNGPAMSRKQSATGYPAQDAVFALKCDELPECTREWFQRQRHYNWPTNYMIQRCETYGCLFVPVGHPNSEEQDKQWRISLSDQERFLVTHFNSVQLKCFVLLKLIKKEIILSKVPDSLTSYHIKTCLLFMIESTPNEFWRPDNLFAAVVICLKKIKDFVENGHCPNYFIPKENIFARRIHGDVRKQLYMVLQKLVDADCKFLLGIKSDGIGEELKHACVSPSEIHCFIGHSRENAHKQIQKRKLRGRISVLNNCFHYYTVYVWKRRRNDLEMTLKILLEHFTDLTSTEEITKHSKEDTRIAKSLILPYLELFMMTNSVAFAVKQGKQEEAIWRYLTSAKWREISLLSDSFSSILKQASLLFMFGYYRESLKVLSTLTALVRFTACICYRDKDERISPSDESLIQATSELTNVSAQDLLRNVIIPCVCFLPTEKTVTPAPLCFEMERMSGIRPTCGDDMYEIDEFYGDGAFVDGNFLLQLLLYLNHKTLKLEERVKTDINYMKSLVSTENVSHKETCLNLLGWVCRDQGDVEKALEYFKLSLEVKPYCNAATLHLLNLSEKPDQ